MGVEGSTAGSTSSGTPAAAATDVWAAVAAARTWAAAAYHFSTWTMYERGWKAMAEAAAAGRTAAAAGKRAVEWDNRLNIAAFKSAGDALRAAMRAQERTRTAFVDAGRHAGASAAAWDAAAKAHALAGNAGGGRDVRMRAEQSRALAEAAPDWVLSADTDAQSTRRALRKWDAIASERSEGDLWDGDRAELLCWQESIHADAEHYAAKWSEEADRAAEAAEMTAGEMQYAREAKKAAALVEGMGRLPPDALEAKEAWNEAVRDAQKASEMRVPPEVRGDQTA